MPATDSNAAKNRSISLGEYPGTAISTIVLGMLGTIGLFVLAWLLGDTARDGYINLTICLLGGSLGCGVAVLSSPYAEADSARFAQLMKSISVFGSGYLLSKFDKVIEEATKPESVLHQAVLLQMAFFGIGFIVIGMATLASRLYFNQRRRAGEQLQTQLAKDTTAASA